MSTVPARNGSGTPPGTAAARTATSPSGIQSAPPSVAVEPPEAGKDGCRSKGRSTVKSLLSEERMNRTIRLADCTCIRQPKLVSYADVGDPDGYVAFFLLGVDSHRYMALMLDNIAKARGIRLICLDRPGRGCSSDFNDDRANRILEFPEILRAFCRTAKIEKFALVGQSLGASYALRCAQEMSDMIATTVYLVSPWVPLSVPGSSRAFAAIEKLPAWLIKGAMSMGTAMPRILMVMGGLNLMVKTCSEEERLLMGSDTTVEVLKAVATVDEPKHGVLLDALAALEKGQAMGFDYRDVSMPVHVFHGRADHMVPFPAVQWMSEEMPACTLSVKMGGTHALLMDTGVLDGVLECMREDFKHFEDPAKCGPAGTAPGGRGPAFSFPAHTQHFKAEGYLRCREGMLVKAWEDRYFILSGFQLRELDGPDSVTARRVVDLRGAVAKVPQESAKRRASDDSISFEHRMFPFKLVDAKHKQLYDLGATTAGDRAYWVDIITKASRFSMGLEKRQGALSKRCLVTTEAKSRAAIGASMVPARPGEGDQHLGARSSLLRRQSLPEPSLRPLAESTPTSPEPIKARKSSKKANPVSRRSSTPGNAVTRRSMSRELLHGTPMRRRGSLPGKRGMQHDDVVREL